jgi:XTP/dITP diphosphohydrolase
VNFVLATANAHKAEEIAAVLATLGHTVTPRPPEVPEVVEDAPDLSGNALLKSRALCAATNEPAIADDTGLFVEALDGAPGVHSARYAGTAGDGANRKKLLGALEGVSNRRAAFRTVIAVTWPDGHEVTVEGVLEGVITLAERGDYGFGYDSLFEVHGRTLAEMSGAEKNEISHRARALAALVAHVGD